MSPFLFVGLWGASSLARIANNLGCLILVPTTPDPAYELSNGQEISLFDVCLTPKGMRDMDKCMAHQGSRMAVLVSTYQKLTA